MWRGNCSVQTHLKGKFDRANALFMENLTEQTYLEENFTEQAYLKENLTGKTPFCIQSCRSCYARLYLCQRSFYKNFCKS
jgi:hypothetical protein